MTLLKVTTVPADVLRMKAKQVKNITQDVKTQIEDMIQTMEEAPGVGLAAPQVGISNAVVVVQFGDEEDEEAPKKTYALINPEISKKSKETVFGIEGCLSIPNIIGEVERHESVVVKGLNKNGQPMKIKASGWLARIFQHEIDHLDGILFTDRATELYVPEEGEDPEEVEAQQIVTRQGLD